MRRVAVLPTSASRSKRTPLVTKKTGMKTPKPIASSLRRKSGWVMARSVSASERIAPAANVPRITSSPSCCAARGEADEQHEGAAHADLRGRVLQPQQVGADAHRALRARGPRRARRRRGRAASRSARSVAPGAALAGEEERQQDDRGEVGDRAAGDDELAERRADPARVLEHRDEHAQRRRAERDGDEQRRLDEAAGAERERDGDRDGERERRSRAR